MLQLLAAAMFTMIALGGIALIVGTLLANGEAILAALANRGDVADPGFVWVARVRRSSRPAPVLSRARPQLARVAA